MGVSMMDDTSKFNQLGCKHSKSYEGFVPTAWEGGYGITDNSVVCDCWHTPNMVLLTFATPSSSIQSKHRKPSVERPRLGARMRAELEKLSWDRTNEDFARAWRFSTGRLDRINDRTDCITLLLNNTSSFLLHHRTSEHLFSFIIPDRELCVSRRRRRAARPPWGDRVASRQRWVDES